MSCYCTCQNRHKPVTFEPHVGSIVKMKGHPDDYLYVVHAIRREPDTRQAVRGCPFGTVSGEEAHKEYDLLLLKHGTFRTARRNELSLIPHDNGQQAYDCWTYQATYRAADGKCRTYETWSSGLPTVVEAKRFFGVWVQHRVPFVWANRVSESVVPRQRYFGLY